MYRNCIITICGRDIMADLVEFEMVDFEAIMDMDWFISYYAVVDCQIKRVYFYFPREAALEWRGNICVPRGKFISYFKAIG